MRPEVPKIKNFLEIGPPPYLKVWIRHCRQTSSWRYGNTSCKKLSAAAESKLLKLPKRAKGPKLHICYCREEWYPSRSKQIICMVTLSVNHSTDIFLPTFALIICNSKNLTISNRNFIPAQHTLMTCNCTYQGRPLQEAEKWIMEFFSSCTGPYT